MLSLIKVTEINGDDLVGNRQLLAIESTEHACSVALSVGGQVLQLLDQARSPSFDSGRVICNHLVLHGRRESGLCKGSHGMT